LRILAARENIALEEGIAAAAENPSGDTCARVSGGKEARVSSGEIRGGINYNRKFETPARAAAIAGSPDGQFLCVGLDDGTLLVTLGSQTPFQGFQVGARRKPSRQPTAIAA
jgi:hypothetical protein